MQGSTIRAPGAPSAPLVRLTDEEMAAAYVKRSAKADLKAEEAEAEGFVLGGKFLTLTGEKLTPPAENAAPEAKEAHLTACRDRALLARESVGGVYRAIGLRRKADDLRRLGSLVRRTATDERVVNWASANRQEAREVYASLSDHPKAERVEKLREMLLARVSGS